MVLGLLTMLIPTAPPHGSAKYSSYDFSLCKNGAYIRRESYGSVTTRWGAASKVGRGGWRGAVLGPDGVKIYGIPTNASSILEVDPIARTVTTFGQLGTVNSEWSCAGALHCGMDKWIGGVLTKAGKIIGIPFAAESVLEVDPMTHSITTFGVISSSLERKWLGGVLAGNGRVYAIPYDADAVLEIDPDTHALSLFGNLGPQPCKWYDGVRAPNDRIYAIPYSERYVLEIDPERRRATPFATVQSGWGKWAGGVLAPNGNIYAIPALATAILEINVAEADTELFGMLPSKGALTDKWNGGVLAPNGKIYGIPWQSTNVLEFDPDTKAVSMLGDLNTANFSWHGGVVAKNGRIVALPYNSRDVLEIGESVCTTGPVITNEIHSDGRGGFDLGPSLAGTAGLFFGEQTTVLATGSSAAAPTKTIATPPAKTAGPASAKADAMPAAAPEATGAKPAAGNALQTFVLAMAGCPAASKAAEDACFNMNHRTWHSAMITIAPLDAMLSSLRTKVDSSGLDMPHNFCFLYKSHPLDPSVEATVKALSAGVPIDQNIVLFIDNLQCNLDATARRGGIKNLDVIISATVLICACGLATLFSILASLRSSRKPTHDKQAAAGKSRAAPARSALDRHCFWLSYRPRPRAVTKQAKLSPAPSPAPEPADNDSNDSKEEREQLLP